MSRDSAKELRDIIDDVMSNEASQRSAEATEELRQIAGEAEETNQEWTDQPMAAFGQGLVESLVPVDTTLGSQYRQRIAESSPVAKSLGKVTGYVGGAVTGMGLPGLGAKLGTAAAKGIANTAGKGLLSRAGQAVASNSVEGALIGVNEGAIAASRGELGLPGVAELVARDMGEGAVIGGGLAGLGGAIGYGLKKTTNALFKKYWKNTIEQTSKNMDDLRKAHEQRVLVEDQVQSLLDDMEVWSASQGRAPGLDEIAKMRTRGEPGFVDPLEELIGSAQGKLDYGGGGRATGPRRAPSRQPAVAGDSLYGQARKNQQKAYDKMETLTNQGLRTLAKEAQDGIGGLATTAAFAGTGGMSYGTGRALRYVIPKVVGIFDDIILGGLDRIKPVREMVRNSLKAGEATLDKIRWVDGDFARIPWKGRGAAKQFQRAYRIPLLESVTDDEYRDIVQEMNDLNIEEMESGLRYGMASHGIPQEFVDPYIQQMAVVKDHLSQHAPAPAEGDWLDEPPPVSDEAKKRFMRRVRAGFIPLSTVYDFAEGQLTLEAADTLWQTNPVLAQEIAKQLERVMRIAQLQGKKISPEMKRQASFLINRGTKMGRTYDPKLVQLLQGNYAEEAAANPGPQPQGTSQPTNIQGLSEDVMTASQGITQRLGM